MFLKFNDKFIEKLKRKSIVDGKSQILENKRYYFSKLKVLSEDIFICVPLHSNARCHYVKIKAPKSKHKKWKNHGLNLEKMLLLSHEELIYQAQASYVEKRVWKDVASKKDLIKVKSEEYLTKYIRTYMKKEKGLILSRMDQNMLKYSSLNAFQDKIFILLRKKNIILEYHDLDY